MERSYLWAYLIFVGLYSDAGTRAYLHLWGSTQRPSPFPTRITTKFTPRNTRARFGLPSCSAKNKAVAVQLFRFQSIVGRKSYFPVTIPDAAAPAALYGASPGPAPPLGCLATRGVNLYVSFIILPLLFGVLCSHYRCKTTKNGKGDHGANLMPGGDGGSIPLGSCPWYSAPA